MGLCTNSYCHALNDQQYIFQRNRRVYASPVSSSRSSTVRLPSSATTRGSPETACSYWAQDLHSLCFSSTGQAETPDPFQRALAHQLLPQQPINSVTHLAELPHSKKQCLALQAIHSPHARYSSPGAPSTNRSKSMQSARCSKDSLQRKRQTTNRCFHGK